MGGSLPKSSADGSLFASITTYRGVCARVAEILTIAVHVALWRNKALFPVPGEYRINFFPLALTVSDNSAYNPRTIAGMI